MTDMPTGVHTFMVEAGEPYEKREMVKPYCSIEDCTDEHEIDPENGQRRAAVEQEWTFDVLDVRRLETGVIATGVGSLWSCGVPGAMFWGDMSDAAADEKRPGSHLFVSGRQLMVILPDRSLWNIDSRAHNCTKPDDFDHRCWIRHGEPPDITVDKAGGATCAAGAGSIQSGDYHGFLAGGVFNP